MVDSVVGHRGRSAHPTRSQPVGDDRFRQQIEEKYGIKRGRIQRGMRRKRMEDVVNKQSLCLHLD